MASSQSDVTQIPSPLWLLQLNRAFPRGVSALGGDAAAAIPDQRRAPGQCWHPARDSGSLGDTQTLGALPRYSNREG